MTHVLFKLYVLMDDSSVVCWSFWLLKKHNAFSALNSENRETKKKLSFYCYDNILYNQAKTGQFIYLNVSRHHSIIHEYFYLFALTDRCMYRSGHMDLKHLIVHSGWTMWCFRLIGLELYMIIQSAILIFNPDVDPVQ